jgi:hypothetical protein
MQNIQVKPDEKIVRLQAEIQALLERVQEHYATMFTHIVNEQISRADTVASITKALDVTHITAEKIYAKQFKRIVCSDRSYSWALMENLKLEVKLSLK